MEKEKSTTFLTTFSNDFNHDADHDSITLICPCHFGLESVLKREINDLGYEVSQVEDGKVSFVGDWQAVCYANVFLRSAERVLVKAGAFRAQTYEELFQGTRAIEWERFLPRDAKFWVAKAASVRSALFSPRDIQSVMKKAMVERMSQKYHLLSFPETGAQFPLRVTILKDEVTVGIDTTGISLHKRGYRLLTAKAPISETLAAALILLTPWKKDRILVDPFCGSGTFPIEAAMIASNIAPGMNREFLSENWDHLIAKKLWYDVIDDAGSRIDDQIETDIQGYDIDGEVIKAARENAKNAGVDHLIHFQRRPVSELSHSGKYGFIITNPPYGGEAFRRLDSWSEYVITSFEQAEKYIGRKADRNRKIYNGMIKTYLYQFQGPKPPKRNRKTDA